MEKIDFYIQKFLQRLDHESIFSYYDKINQGKRLRSKLMLSICEDELVYKLCAIVECIHLASLLHDDVIDNASMRRGSASINAIFGDKNAIMLGDILYSTAFYELCEYDKKIAKSISNAVSVLSSGELLDVELSSSFNDDVDKYLKMVYRKTAVLIEASAEVAAVLAKKDSQKYASYGKNLGIAFQIVDDLLDVSKSSDELGKPAFQDFKEGKSSMPYIFLYKALNDNDKQRLLGYFGKDLSGDDISWLKSKFLEFEIYDKVKNEAMKYGNAAWNEIKDQNNKRLEEIIEKMIFRNF